MVVLKNTLKDDYKILLLLNNLTSALHMKFSVVDLVYSVLELDDAKKLVKFQSQVNLFSSSVKKSLFDLIEELKVFLGLAFVYKSKAKVTDYFLEDESLIIIDLED